MHAVHTTEHRYCRSKITYYIPDASDSPIAAADEQGEVLWRKHYRPFGEEIEQDAASKNNHIGYTGHVHDRDTGLTYMRARFYDPVVGRFMGMDSAGVNPNVPRTFNRFAYGNNSPYKFVDPDGRVVKEAIIGGGIIAAKICAKSPSCSKAVKAGVNKIKKRYFTKKQKVDRHKEVEGKCEYCGKDTQTEEPFKSDSAEGDHIKSQSDGGKTDYSNQANACRECNGVGQKGAKELGTEWEAPKLNQRIQKIQDENINNSK